MEFTGKISGDPTGNYITPSLSGNNYILIVYNYDSDSIHVKPLVSRTNEFKLLAYEDIILLVKNHGQSPRIFTLDNEASALLIDFIHSENITVR